MGRQPLRILVVDDDRDVADSLAALLRIHDYDVCVVYSGKGAVEIAGCYRPDIVILDVNMPEMDGFQTARHLKRDRRLQRAPLIAYSAAAEPLTKRVAEQIGFRKFVSKGGFPSELLDALSELDDNGH